MTEKLSEQEIARYARHLVLPEIGGAGQQKLKAARVLVIGAGGLGAPALQYLASCGVGHLTIVDDDVVSLSNLQRQIIHDTNQVGSAKVESAAQRIGAINPHVQIEAVQERVTQANCEALICGHTIAVDGSDNFATRYLMADTCANLCVPLVTAAVNRFDGSITTLRPWENGNPSYRDLFPTQPQDGTQPTCAETGILGAVTGILGTMQALEVMKEITGTGTGLVGRLMMIDCLSMRVQTISYGRKK